MIRKKHAFVVYALLLNGCTYNGQLNDSTVIPTTLTKGAGESITLITDKKEISDPTIQINAFTLNYDIKDAYLKGVQTALKSGYSKVVPNSTPIAENKFYAVPRLNSRTTYTTATSVGLDLRAGVDIYDTSTRQLLNSYERHGTADYATPAAVSQMGAITGMLLMLPAPYTIPTGLRMCGEQGQAAIKTGLRTALTELSMDISHGNKSVTETTYSSNSQKGKSGDFSQKLSGIKKQCTELGFKEGTKPFGDCVMKLMD